MKEKKIMKSQHQMSEIEHNAFEEHCKASETYKTIRVDTTTTVNFNGDLADEFSGEDVVDTKWIKVKGYDNGKSSPKCFDWPKHLQESFNEVDDKHHNGYYQQKYMEDCYPCATQRHKCEHDGRDDSEDLPEWWNEV